MYCKFYGRAIKDIIDFSSKQHQKSARLLLPIFQKPLKTVSFMDWFFFLDKSGLRISHLLKQFFRDYVCLPQIQAMQFCDRWNHVLYGFLSIVTREKIQRRRSRKKPSSWAQKFTD